MDLLGKQLIGFQQTAEGNTSFTAFNPVTGAELSPPYHEATLSEVDAAIQAAAQAFPIYRAISADQKAAFLEAIADEILALGDQLLERGTAETGLPTGRLTGERGRTMGQLRLFAQVVREGSWVRARIDTADPDRTPFPKADIRQMQIPMGPVAVFGASNFPLAFSVAGGDTASALAAGCPVIVKGHPAHPGTSELVGRAIIKAAQTTGMPEGVFSMVHGAGHAVGLALVQHPLIEAVGFTGSYQGGKALFDAANRREKPIPVYAEMGSTNPVFILPAALASRGDALAQGLAQSVTLGVGQFCTNPGLVVTLDSSAADSFLNATGQLLAQHEGGSMLTEGIQSAFIAGTEQMSHTEGVEVQAASEAHNSQSGVGAWMFQASAETVMANPKLAEEVFGPSTLAVRAQDKAELLRFASQLSGHLTATVHATEEELPAYADLLDILAQKVGRLIINGFPTGVEVCHSMVHGGPFPATTDSRSTSVGTAAIERFSRPFCYQSFPQTLLPVELQDDNPQGIMRMLNGKWDNS